MTRLMQCDLVQPDDVRVVVRQLQMVAIVRATRVRLEMSMNGRAGVVSVHLVHVLRGNACREGQARCQKERDSDSTEGTCHLL
ncbi:MAG: hypothetical protein AB7N65_00435 [Vicinamibacterales bacterium]